MVGNNFKFEPMPKRFKVWEGSQGRFRGEILPGNVRRTTYTLTELLVWYDGDDIVDLTIVQSTGLYDKNGVEIFEGDIVKTKYLRNPYRVVKYGYKNFEEEYCGSFVVGGSRVLDRCLSGILPSDIEVAGNIFENPELLEEK